MSRSVLTGFVECRVYDRSEPVSVGEHSDVMAGEFCGWVSLSARDVEFSDDEVFELLDSAHARDSFIRQFFALHNKATGSMRELGVTGTVEVDSVSMEFRVTESYLNEVIGEMDGGGKVLDSLERYDTPVTVVSGDQ